MNIIRKIKPVMEGRTESEKKTLLFAAFELQKYLARISDSDFTVIPSENYRGKDSNSLYLGVELLGNPLPDVEDKTLDDAISVSVDNVSGVITATNARAVLIAVYRYLKELGFKFLRPGEKGEYYPTELNDKKVVICEKPSYRHRTVCIEGCVSQKRLMDTIDWLPKAGLNGYLVQFVLPRPFMERWYGGLWYLLDPVYRPKTKLTDDELKAILILAENDIEKRGLIYHGVGHGWTNRAFGIDMDGWGKSDNSKVKYPHIIAQINGQRKLYNGSPANTSLCFSNPEARRRMADVVVNYAKEHRNLDYLHVWSSDGQNNNCECDECRKQRFSDWMITLLNEIDERLTEEGIDTKIVFIIYVDFFWKPLNAKLKNKNRFLMGFAPIFRSFSDSFDTDKKGTMLPYEVNKLQFPESVEDNLAYWHDWKTDFDCDTFVFDYHFMWDHFIDFPQYNHARILSRDIKSFEKNGINGLINCKVNTTYLPSSLGSYVMTETLWNKDVDFETLADFALSTEFGCDFKAVKEYLSTLSDHGCAKALRGEESISIPENIKDLKYAIKMIDGFQNTIKTHLSDDNKQIADCWSRLQFFSELYKMVLELALKVAKGREVGDVTYIYDFLLRNEYRLKDEFDATYFMQTFSGRILGALKLSKEKFIGNEEK